MDCRECQQLLDDLLVAAPSEAAYAELSEHVRSCPECAHEHRLAGQALVALAPPRPAVATRSLRERILSAAAAVAAGEVKRANSHARRPWILEFTQRLAPLAAAASIVVVAGLLLWRQYREPVNEPVGIPAFTLVSRAYAAEAAIFAGGPIVHIVNEIVVKPVADANLAGAQWWLPVASLEGSGKPRMHQLALPGGRGQGYSIVDECWYEQVTGHFKRQLTQDGRPIYANSFDGEAIYWLNAAADGGAKVEREPVAAGFKAPESPESLLGMTAGLPAQIDETNKDLVADAGKVVLDDGAAARQVRLGYPGPSADKKLPGYMLVTIRSDDNTIARLAMVLDEKPVYEIRRTKTETLASATVGWNLSDVEGVKGEAPAAPAHIVSDIVKTDVSPADMAERASFPTYLFKSAPDWAPKREIVDVLDVASPPNRMFIVVYGATDGRHVVLIQAPTYNQMSSAMQKFGKVVYTSPDGVKVYSGQQDKWLAGILLTSARMYIKDPPVEDRTGYLLLTPAGTTPALAVNGRLSDEELHRLVDSLAPTDGGN